MSQLQSSNDIYIYETERRPNLYAANVLAGVVGVIAVTFFLNEIGLFAVNRLLMQICLGISLILFTLIQLMVHNRKQAVHPSSKYVIISMTLLFVLTVTVLLNIHAVLAFVLPLLLATQYRSRTVSSVALIGSVVCCGVAPFLSYFLNTWSLVFLTGYIQTFCRVTISTAPAQAFNIQQDLLSITLYWSMPQMLTLAAFGFILFSVTKSGIDSVRNQMQVVDLSNDLQSQLESITSIQEKVLYSMSDIIENRDVETGGHVRRTIEIVRLLIEAMRSDPDFDISDSFCNDVIRSAPMHDLGKISIPDAILHKPGKLTDEEYEIVKQHPINSAKIITNALTGIENEQLLRVAKNIGLYHHERFDGTGYPEQLSGNDIPLEARVMAIADVYDALVSERCYKAPLSFSEAFDTIESLMGTHFDASLNRYFVGCRDEIEHFYMK